MDRRPARWNFVSLAAPFVGFPFGVWAAVALSPTHFPNTQAGFLVWGGFCSLGICAAALALARGERWWGVTVAGLVLNTVVLPFTAWAAAQG